MFWNTTYPSPRLPRSWGISERHTKRLLAAYRRDGPAAQAHGNRGRRPHNAVPEAAATAVVKLASNHYAGANHTHFTELLREREGIDLSRPTVRRILVRAGLGSPRSRRSPQHRFRRRRMPQEGMLVQDRGPRLVLLLAVDDATGVVAQAVFHPSEDTRGYLALLEGMVRQWGIPLALYSDRHAAFKYNARQGPVLYESTQFARVMRELGIQQIFALSPQAKGRVERMASTFRTGWSPSCAWLAPAPSTRPMTSFRSSCPGSTPVSPWPRSSRREPTARCPPNYLSPRPSASSTPARWPGTTRSNTSGGSCNCSPGWTGPAMPASRRRSWNGPTAS